MNFTEEELQEFESMITLEVAYTGKINPKLERDIELIIPINLQDVGVNGKWYFSEASLQKPFHRIIGFELDRELSYDAKIKFISDINWIFKGKLLIVQI
jgi:hypothetical protein